MQCNNCQFENIPGVHACGRCGASLQLASLMVDVHPPRTAGAKLAAAVVSHPSLLVPPPLRAERHAPEDKRLARRLANPRGAPAHDRSRLGATLHGACPAGHAAVRRLFRLAPLGLAVPRHRLGLAAVGLRIALHAASLMDIVAADVLDGRQRLIYTGIAMTLLLTLVYVPLGRLLARVASPSAVQCGCAAVCSGRRGVGQSVGLPGCRSATRRRGALPVAPTRHPDSGARQAWDLSPAGRLHRSHPGQGRPESGLWPKAHCWLTGRLRPGCRSTNRRCRKGWRLRSPRTVT